MEWGPFLKDLQETAKITGRQPQALLDRPSLRGHLEHPYEGFRRLSRRRMPVVGGVAPLALSEMYRWLDETRIFDEAKREEYLTLLEAADEKYIEFTMERLKRETEKAKDKKTDS